MMELMKFRVERIVFLILIIVGSSCKKESLMELDKGNTPLQLSVDHAELVLAEKNATADAFVFNWTSGSNGGTNSSISYVFQLDKQGNNFADPIESDLGKASYTKKFTVAELNNVLLTKWSSPGVEHALEARVISEVSGATDIAELSTMQIKVTPYQPVAKTLYLIGDAAPFGWSPDNASPMKLSASMPGQFAWEGTLSAGELKFITTLGQFSPSYVMGSASSKLTYRTEDSQPDDKFPILSSGRYSIAVDLLNLTIAIKEAPGAPFEKLWMLGDAVPTGWDINNPAEMHVAAYNDFIFTYNEVLNAGEFKVPTTTGDFNTAYYMPMKNYPDLTETGVQLMPVGGSDFKWKITDPGAYKIKLDLETMKIEIKKFTPYAQIWMVGDATPAGWNIDNPTPMTVDPNDPYVFTYTGPMNAGEFKMPVFTGNGWAGDFFMPETNEEGAESVKMRFVPNGNPDFKWKLIEAGRYKITINQLYETISIVKL